MPEESEMKGEHQIFNENSDKWLKIEEKNDPSATNSQSLVVNSFQQKLNTTTSSVETVEKFALFDDESKENLTLSKLIDYFLGDFPSKCENNNLTVCNFALKDNSQVLNKPNVINGKHFFSRNLQSKELETADFMAQLQMTREMSFDHGAIHHFL